MIFYGSFSEFMSDVLYKLALLYMCWVLLVITLAAFGKTFYVRFLFVKTLILIFEWGKERISEHEREQEEAMGLHDISEDENEGKETSVISNEDKIGTGAPPTQGRCTRSRSRMMMIKDSVLERGDQKPTEHTEGDEKNDDILNQTAQDAVDSVEGTQPIKHKLGRHEYDEVLSTKTNGDTCETDHIIEREIQLSSTKFRVRNMRTVEELRHEYELSDAMYFAKCGIEAIIDDGVTQRFSAVELPSWNLLTRTHNKHEFISYRLTVLWALGWFLRYVILLPFRFSLSMVAINGMIIGTAFIGYFVPQGSIRRRMYLSLSKTCYRIMGRAFSAIIDFHNIENRAKGGGICVANHTSPIDIIVLGCDNVYAMVGQAQGGFFGIMQKAFSRAETHIWFNRSEAADRSAVGRRLQEHVEDANKLPILIFPEGTCINNTSIMMFKKGSFETGGVIHPVAIKYDSRFADPFWNSSRTNLIHHLLLIMTSWSLVVDVWYLPSQVKRDDETSVEFANRVKSEIAQQGGLVDLEWDGGLKRDKVKPQMKQKQQENYSKTIKSE